MCNAFLFLLFPHHCFVSSYKLSFLFEGHSECYLTTDYEDSTNHIPNFLKYPLRSTRPSTYNITNISLPLPLSPNPSPLIRDDSGQPAVCEADLLGLCSTLSQEKMDVSGALATVTAKYRKTLDTLAKVLQKQSDSA